MTRSASAQAHKQAADKIVNDLHVWLQTIEAGRGQQIFHDDAERMSETIRQPIIAALNRAFLVGLAQGRGEQAESDAKLVEKLVFDAGYASLSVELAAALRHAAGGE